MILNVTEEQKKLIEAQGHMVVEFKLWCKKLLEHLGEVIQRMIAGLKEAMADDEMSLFEYAEKVSPVPLTDCQKKLFEAYEQAQKENKKLLVIPARNAGREMVLQIIDAWKNGTELEEHRCSCGRLLGRFNGQAEVKCPKCGKMNVIGVEKYET